MRTADVIVVDYGVGNLLSVRRGLEYHDAIVEVTGDPQIVLRAPRVILPGVGAFGDGMHELRRAGLDFVIREVAAKGVPVLGVCLGMQMLLNESEEFGRNPGLGLIPGRVVAIPPTTIVGQPLKIPHIGWNDLLFSDHREGWRGTPLEDISEGEAVYFVHSFMAEPDCGRDRIAQCLYGGRLITAAICRQNVFGCQFHPEKSGEVGLKVLGRFLKL